MLSSSITELQNYTFTNEPPFDVLGIPECSYQVQPQMMLYLPPINKTQITSFIKRFVIQSRGSWNQSCHCKPTARVMYYGDLNTAHLNCRNIWLLLVHNSSHDLTNIILNRHSSHDKNNGLKFNYSVHQSRTYNLSQRIKSST